MVVWIFAVSSVGCSFAQTLVARKASHTSYEWFGEVEVLERDPVLVVLALDLQSDWM
jgi:hypothetical protein